MIGEQSCTCIQSIIIQHKIIKLKKLESANIKVSIAHRDKAYMLRKKATTCKKIFAKHYTRYDIVSNY